MKVSVTIIALLALESFAYYTSTDQCAKCVTGTEKIYCLTADGDFWRATNSASTICRSSGECTSAQLTVAAGATTECAQAVGTTGLRGISSADYILTIPEGASETEGTSTDPITMAAGSSLLVTLLNGQTTTVEAHDGSIKQGAWKYTANEGSDISGVSAWYKVDLDADGMLIEGEPDWMTGAPDTMYNFQEASMVYAYSSASTKIEI